MTETVAVPAKTEAPKVEPVKIIPARSTRAARRRHSKNALAVRTRVLRGARPKAVAPPAPTFTALAKRAHPLKKPAKG